MKLLLEAGANPNVLDIHKQTPLQKAEAAGHTETARMLRKVMQVPASTTTAPAATPAAAS